MANISLENRMYTITREFKGEVSIKQIIIEALKEGRHDRSVKLTKDDKICYNTDGSVHSAGGTIK